MLGADPESGRRDFALRRTLPVYNSSIHSMDVRSARYDDDIINRCGLQRHLYRIKPLVTPEPKCVVRNWYAS